MKNQNTNNGSAATTLKALSDSSNVSICVASPDVIRGWSKGEVKSPETINYRTLKAEKNGLFCERIFGPTKDYECSCGKYKRQKFDGVICDRCGVEVTRARVRRERMGHIELECPVTHVWFYKCAPSRLGLLLEIPQKDLDKVLYYENYIVTDPGDTPLKLKQTLTNEEYAENVANYGDEFKAGMGAEAIEILLKNIGLDTLKSELKDIPKRIEELSQRLKKSGKAKKVAADDAAAEAMEFDKQVLADEKAELEETLKTLIERKKIVDNGKDTERMKALLETELDVLRSQVSKTNSQQIRKQKVKRIRLIEGFVRNNMDPTWMILKVLPVIPPDLRPLVPLDGGRFATSDLNDLYRRVLNRNARLHKFYESNCPDVITRNEKRMLQEAVDALMDNGRHGRPITGTGNRPLKSLTDMLKGKQGRFRQNLLGKRVDYSGRSVIVVGPELNINQCGLPKEMALRLFEPFIVRSLRQSGQVHTTRNAKKWIEERRKEVWDVLDNVVSGHPILLNRAPTLHRISIQAFDPVLIDGQAIRLHPLVCAAFNADFDGDQMAVHVPLSNEAQLEAKLIMLSPNNIFSPADGRPLALPSQDMVLGVYYLCYEDENLKNAFLDKPAYEQPHYDTYEEVLQAMEAHRLANENNRNSREPINVGLGIHDFFYFKNPYYRDAAETARIAALTGAEKEKQDIEDRKMVWGNRKERWIATTPGRMIYHEIWPEVLGFWNKKAVKKDIQNMIKQCHEVCGHEELLPLLDRLKNLGYAWATRSGFSIAIADMLIPAEKGEYIKQAEADVAAARQEQEKGSIDESVRSQKCIDIWTKVRENLKGALQKTLKANAGHAGINSVWAMLESGARGNADQVNQVGGMRGLMSNTTGDVVETPIIHNFREGLTGLEYFNSTHGSRKGMADTALKTADAGYMTRRLVDVAHDVICTQEDCGTASGIWISALKDGNKETKSLTDRIVGRFSADDIYDSMGNRIVAAGEEITPYIASKIKEAGYEKVHIRSVLTCAAARGVCAKCYGRNLATGELPMEGDALGIIAAQSIGEPGTQLTLRTFHSGGTASTTASEKEIKVKWEQASSELRSKIEDLEAKAKASGWSDKKLKDEKASLEEKENVAFLSFDNLEWIPGKDENNKAAKIVISRDGHIRAKNATFSRDSKKPVMGDVDLVTYDIPYGAILRVDNEQLVKPGDIIASVDPFTTPVIARQAGKIVYEDLLDGQTMRKTFNKQSGKHEMVVIQHPEDTHPALVITERKKDGKILETEALSEGAQILVNDGERVEAGQFIAKTPKTQAKTSDITTGLPRVAELFEARRPKEAAIIAKVSGTVVIGKQSKNKVLVTIADAEAIFESKLNSGNCNMKDFKELSITQKDVDDYCKTLGVDEKRDWKEKAEHLVPTGKRLIVNNGDYVEAGACLTDGAPVLQDYLAVCGEDKLRALLVESVQRVYLSQGVGINDKHIEVIVRQMMRKVRITNPHDTGLLTGETVDYNTFKRENDRVLGENKEAAEGQQILQGITKASLATDSFISAASFQDTPRILTEAATLGRKDFLHGFKENVIMGHLIPAGTGYYKLQNPALKTFDADGNLIDIEDDHGVQTKQDSVYDDDIDAPKFGDAVDVQDMEENGMNIENSAKSAGLSDGSGADLLDNI